MALQDLTPQLRTRLSRVERAVGWFVVLATALLFFGFGYYIYNTAQRKGWFTPKFKYQTWLNNSAGLKVGDTVKLMGSPAGQITEIIPNEPSAYFGLTVNFVILKPHYGYIWDDSKVKVSSDFLGNRFLEVTKGLAGVPTIEETTNKAPIAMLRWKVARTMRPMVLEDVRKAHPGLEETNREAFNWFFMEEFKQRIATNAEACYTNLGEIYGLDPEEAPALNDRLERLANQVETALPNILNLTNKIAAALDNTAELTSNLNRVATSAFPVVSNLAAATGTLNRPGALGEWLLPTSINQKLDSLLGGADATVANSNTNLAIVLENLNRSLLNLADLTSNLNHQVQMNTNILSQISRAVVDADDLVQGLKRHWFLRSAFKTERTNAPAKATAPVRSPKDRGGR